MNTGNKKVIPVEYKNIGDTAVYSAQARISAVDPFTSSDDTAYIGISTREGSKAVSFVISVDRTTTLKEYGLDSEIRYRDALDNTYISDPMKVRIKVTATTGLITILSNPFYLSMVLVGIIGALYMFFHYRRKNNQ